MDCDVALWAKFLQKVHCWSCGTQSYKTDWGWTGGDVDEENPIWPTCPNCGIECKKASDALWDDMSQKITCPGCGYSSYITSWGNGGGNADPSNPKWPTCPVCQDYIAMECL